jgi:tetratricopeptide (TPR) repeat protein
MAYSVESKSKNPANALRDDLDRAEREVVQLNRETVETFLVRLDRIDHAFETLTAGSVDLRPEEVRWQSLLHRLDSKPQPLVAAAAAAGGLARLRANHPPAESFWWHLDAEVNRRRLRAIRRAVVTLVVAVVVIVGGYYALNAIFPPNPAAVRMLEVNSQLEPFIATGDWDAALAVVTEAQAELPDEVELVLWEVVLAHEAGDAARSEDALARAQAMMPDQQPELWVQLGTYYLQVGDLATASEAAQQAATLAPDNPQVTFLQANLAEEQGDVATAIDRFQRTFELAEDDNPQLAVIARVRLGNLLQRAPAMAPSAPVTTTTTVTDGTP